jgi:aldehyde dehydrogenase (NAD+)
MREMLKFYIDGKWVDPVKANPVDVINPATEESCGRISLGSAADVDLAVAAAKRAGPGYAATTREHWRRVPRPAAALSTSRRQSGRSRPSISRNVTAPP